jgi:hypothetical protein
VQPRPQSSETDRLGEELLGEPLGDDDDDVATLGVPLGVELGPALGEELGRALDSIGMLRWDGSYCSYLVVVRVVQ